MPPSIQPQGKARPQRPQGAAPREDLDRTQVMPRQGQPSPGRPAAYGRGAAEGAAHRPRSRAEQAPRTQPAPAPAPQRKPRRRRPSFLRIVALLLVLVAVSLGVFAFWASSQINHVDALSGAADTPGRTYLIVGSDSRDDWDDDGTEGARTDTIMVLHKPESGPVALISIPRDSYVEIPGHSANKINASFAFGGAPLLVETVEGVTNLTIDLYLEVGFNGVADMVDAVGGVELCYDEDVSDWRSRLEWEAGCHEADGETALAFSRMRYSDPLGDIGRTQRQRQVVSAVANEALSPATLLNPFTMVGLTSAGLDAFAVSEGTGVVDLARAALDLRSGLGGDAVTGTPPIRSMGYSVAGVGSTVLLDPDLEDAFWADIAAGAFEPGETVGGVG